MKHLKMRIFLYLGILILYLFNDFFGYVGNVNFYKKNITFFTNHVFVKQFTVLNDVSNCKPMIIIQNAYSLTEID